MDIQIPPVEIVKHQLSRDGGSVYVQFSDDKILQIDFNGRIIDPRTTNVIGTVKEETWSLTAPVEQKMAWVMSAYVQRLRNKAISAEATRMSLEDEVTLSPVAESELVVGSSAVLQQYMKQNGLELLATPQRETPAQQQRADALGSIRTKRVPMKHAMARPKRDRAGKFTEPIIYDQ